MNKRAAIGLIGAGKLTDSPLLRLWAWRERLGPVKAPSVRVASRMSNSLRAGYPVGDYDEFETCGLILISVPDPLLPGIVGELSIAPLTWAKKVVVVCSPLMGARELDPLAQAGASAGSVCSIPGSENRWLLLEGDAFVDSSMRQVIDQGAIRVTRIPPSCKPLYLTALALTGSNFMPMLMQASDALRKAGVPARESAAIVEKNVEQCLRSHFRVGRKVRRARDNESAATRFRSHQE